MFAIQQKSHSEIDRNVNVAAVEALLQTQFCINSL